ncbi:MAG TPA: cell division ATP-binding protein FtsE [Thermoanaerobaculia bacterium]|nr:cell division ATP-binding protein FtsE [Thermoanaerobaculia bacterium]
MTRSATCGALSSPEAMIHFYHVTKKFDRYSTALHDITFHVEKGEYVFLTGPSGAGKSTLLNLILKQINPTEGQIVVNGRNLNAMKRSQLPYFRREIGMVFQDFKLIARMTVFENLSFILTVLGVPPKEHKKKAYGALRAVNLPHKLNAYPLQLSGGEQQRVAIARALINDPLVLVADEPTGNLDPDLSAEVIQIFNEANLRGSTVLLATHDRELIRNSGRRVIALDHGRIIEEKVAAQERPPARSDSVFVNWGTEP